MGACFQSSQQARQWLCMTTCIRKSLLACLMHVQSATSWGVRTFDCVWNCARPALCQWHAQPAPFTVIASHSGTYQLARMLGGVPLEVHVNSTRYLTKVLDCILHDLLFVKNWDYCLIPKS